MERWGYHNRSRVRRSLLRGDSDVIGRAGNGARPRSSGISLGLRRLRAPCKPHNNKLPGTSGFRGKALAVLMLPQPRTQVG